MELVICLILSDVILTRFRTCSLLDLPLGLMESLLEFIDTFIDSLIHDSLLVFNRVIIEVDKVFVYLDQCFI
jgi:hypothetical protein